MPQPMYEMRKKELLESRATPFWVAETLRLCDSKDVLDVLYGLDALTLIFNIKEQEVLSTYRKR